MVGAVERSGHDEKGEQPEMSQNNAYLDCYTSLLAYCKQFIAQNNINGFQVFDFEAHAATQELPASGLIGITDYSIQNSTDMYDITVMFMICTLSTDSNLKILRDLVSRFFAELTPGSQFPLMDKDGETRGYFTIKDDVMVTSVGSTKTRPIQGIAVSLGAGYLQPPTL